MRYALNRVIATGQQGMIKTYGDAVWCSVADTFVEWFRLSDVAVVPCLAGLAPRTRLTIARCVMANVEAEYEDNPDDCPFTRTGPVYRWK